MIKIERILLWFKDGGLMLNTLNAEYFEIGILLNRLLNEKYQGKKIKFINIDFCTDLTYQQYSNLPKNTPYAYGGHLKYFGSIDLNKFQSLHKAEKKEFIWGKSCQYLSDIAKSINNADLLEATSSAYKKGVALNFNADFKVLEKSITLNGVIITVSIWINFLDDIMVSNLIIEKDGKIHFERKLDQTKKGVEVFLDMYKSIDYIDGNIVINGRKISNSPVNIPINLEAIQ